MKRGVILVLFLLLLPSTLAFELGQFPDLFIDGTIFNATIVIGSEATVSDRIAMSDLEDAIQEYLKEQTKTKGILMRQSILKRMAVELQDPEDKDLIIIGLHPDRAKEGNPMIANYNIEIREDTGTLALRRVGEHFHLIITGDEPQDIIAAANVLKDFGNRELRGLDLHVPRQTDVLQWLPSQIPLCGDNLCETARSIPPMETNTSPFWN